MPRSVLRLAARQVRGDVDADAIAAALAYDRGRSCIAADAPLVASLREEGAPNPAGGGGGGGGVGGPLKPPPAEAQTDLHRLQREVQWEVARLPQAHARLVEADPPGASLRGATESAGGSPGHGVGGTSVGGATAAGSPSALSTMVQLDEFLHTLFVASMGTGLGGVGFAGGGPGAHGIGAVGGEAVSSH